MIMKADMMIKIDIQSLTLSKSLYRVFIWKAYKYAQDAMVGYNILEHMSNETESAFIAIAKLQSCFGVLFWFPLGTRVSQRITHK